MKKNSLLFISMMLTFAAFAQTMTSVTPSSANAGQTLDVTITGQNTHFTATGNKVSFGFDQGSSTTAVNSITPISDTQLKVNVTVPVSTTTGDYSVATYNSVDNPSKLPAGIHIIGIPQPTLTAMSPAIINAGQTLDVTITGRNTHFSTNGNNTVTFGFGQGSATTTANSTTPYDDTVLKANITIPANAYNGSYPLSVSNSTDGWLVLQNAYQVTGNPAPQIISVSPKSGIAGRTMDVIITGQFTHFMTVSTEVTFGFRNGNGTTAVNSTTVLSDTTIKANITIPAFITTGDYDVGIKSIDHSSSLTNAFHVTAGQQPVIVDVNPNNANARQTLDVTITGANTHFKSAGSTVTFGFFSQATATTVINSVNPVNDSSLIVNMTIPATAKAGNYNVDVSNAMDGSISLYNGFRINDQPQQYIASINPKTANVGQSLDVTIKGVNTHFDPSSGLKVTFYFSKVSGNTTTVSNSVTVINDTIFKANISIPDDVYTGDYSLDVSDSIDGLFPTQSPTLHVNGVKLPPAIHTNVSGMQAEETISLILKGINGTHFNQPGSKTTIDFIADRPMLINSKNIVNDSVIDLNITAPAVGAGYRIEVTDSIDGKMISFFKVYPNCIASFVTTYDPTSNSFTLTLDSATSKATSFHWDFGDGTISTDSFPSHVFTEDKIYNVCLQITNFAGDSCRYCHEIGIDSLGNPIFKTKGFSMYAKPYKDVILGIPGNGSDAHFISVYPNPADNVITVVSSTPISALNKPVLSIYSIEGKLLLQQAFVKEKMILDISALKKGIYIMQLTGSKQTEIIKFTKE